MYYLIRFIDGRDMEIEKVEGKNIGFEASEWVVEANSEEDAKSKLMEHEHCVDIKEISLEERIEREENDLRQAIKWEYVYRRYGDASIKEFSKIQKQLNEDGEIYYKALVDYNKAQRLLKRLARRKEFGSLSMAEYKELLNKLVDAKTEEEFNAILQSVDKRD